MLTQEIIDAINAGIQLFDPPLSVKRTFLYHRPVSLVGSTGFRVPALAIAPVKSRAEMIATSSSYSHEHRIRITYYGLQIGAQRTGVADEAAAADLLTESGQIIDWLCTLGGGLELESGKQNEVTVYDIDYGPIEGGYWVAEIDVRIRTWSF